jgi:hypothetical protein
MHSHKEYVMRDIFIGTSALPSANVDLMKQAGIGWLRHGFPFPDRLGGELSERYVQAREAARQRSAQGFRLMGVSPGLGIGTMKEDEQGQLRMVWQGRTPPWMGQPGTPEFARHYRELCTFLASDLRGVVQMWQIANELEIPQFAGPLNMRQACDLVIQAAHGLKEGDPDLIVGANTGGSVRSYYLYGRLYADPRAPLDYCGVDQYYGTWQAGGPDTWRERLQELWDLTGLRVLINEWGYASAGGLQALEEQQVRAPICQTHKWRNAWGSGHTAEVQGEYVRVAHEILNEKRDILLGAFFYRWEDQDRCWQCGRADCPVETAWGLVDRQGQPKPAYHTFREGVRRLLAG